MTDIPDLVAQRQAADTAAAAKVAAEVAILRRRGQVAVAQRLEDSVTDHQSAVAPIDEEIERTTMGLAERLTTLEQRVDGLAGVDIELDARLDQEEAEGDAFAVSITQLNARTAALELADPKMAAAIAALDTRLDTEEALSAILDNRADALEAEDAEVAQYLADLDARIDQAEADILGIEVGTGPGGTMAPGEIAFSSFPGATVAAKFNHFVDVFIPAIKVNAPGKTVVFGDAVYVTTRQFPKKAGLSMRGVARAGEWSTGTVIQYTGSATSLWADYTNAGYSYPNPPAPRDVHCKGIQFVGQRVTWRTHCLT